MFIFDNFISISQNLHKSFILYVLFWFCYELCVNLWHLPIFFWVPHYGVILKCMDDIDQYKTVPSKKTSCVSIWPIVVNKWGSDNSLLVVRSKTFQSKSSLCFKGVHLKMSSVLFLLTYVSLHCIMREKTEVKSYGFLTMAIFFVHGHICFFSHH